MQGDFFQERIDTEGFSTPAFLGECNQRFEPVDLEAAVAALTDPGSATETLYWGRNYLYAAEIETPAGTVEVAVKQFRNQGWRRRIERRLKGSKAERSWRGAIAVAQARVPTPEPLLLIDSRQPDGPSFFVSRRLTGFVEARYYFRSLEAGSEGNDYPEIEAEQLMVGLGESIRRLHAAGVWHRDLSIGNLLLVPRTRRKHRGRDHGGDAGAEPGSDQARDSAYDGGTDAGEEMTIYFIDLNRARTGCRLTVSRRTRDLCRLRIFRRQHQELFLRSYWRDRMTGFAFKRWLYRCYFHGFLWKIRFKGLVRAPFRWIASLAPRRAHAHIPDAPTGASKRDRVVWDVLSDQPHQHAGRLERLSVRVGDARHHLREGGAAVAALPRVWSRYRELEAGLYREPVVFSGAGVAVRPWADDPEAQLSALDRLGTKQLLLRLHPWQDDDRDELTLARELVRRGFELAFTLPQNRELVRDRARWRDALTRIGEQFAPLGKQFQIGQAINRSKWGVWNYREYVDLARDASEILHRYPGIELMGPAVIDYELHRTAGIVNVVRDEVRFDILASLLYVDRRGAPENRQLGFDTVDKVTQLKAIAETADSCGDRSWITEVNWPLWEGPHSPAGKTVSVDEQTQADYLARFYLLALGSGMTERVYWWQLIARGYGLMFGDGSRTLVERPGFRTLATLCSQLEGSVFRGPLPAVAPVRLYRFDSRQGEPVLVAWSADSSPTTIELPGRATRVVDRDGNEVAPPARSEIRIDGSPRYIWLAGD